MGSLVDLRCLLKLWRAAATAACRAAFSRSPVRKEIGSSLLSCLVVIVQKPHCVWGIGAPRPFCREVAKRISHVQPWSGVPVAIDIESVLVEFLALRNRPHAGASSHARDENQPCAGWNQRGVTT